MPAAKSPIVGYAVISRLSGWLLWSLSNNDFFCGGGGCDGRLPVVVIGSFDEVLAVSVGDDVSYFWSVSIQKYGMNEKMI